MVLKGYRGDVGIGTLIVFIAMVLVAAIAAAVLLNVSGMLQQRASATGKETTKQVSSNIMVQSVVGRSPSGQSNITNLTLTIKAAAGSGKIDFRNLLVVVNNGTNEAKLVTNVSCGSSPCRCSTANNTIFGVVERVDPNNVLDPDTCTLVMDSSTLVDINLYVNRSVLNQRGFIEVQMIPEVGSPVTIEIKGPEVIRPDSIYQLYP